MAKVRSFTAAVVLAIAASMAVPATASAMKRDAGSCPGNKTLVSLQHKTCPSTRRRAAVVLSRACCSNTHGKVKCRKFPHCPKRSPS